MYTRELELSWLVRKINKSESLIDRAEEYFEERHHLWSDGVTSYFQDMLERKREQLDYEKHRAEKLGWAIVAGREEPKLDI